MPDADHDSFRHLLAVWIYSHLLHQHFRDECAAEYMAELNGEATP